MQALFVSWWGWGDTATWTATSRASRMRYLNRGITALLDQIAATTEQPKDQGRR